MLAEDRMRHAAMLLKAAIAPTSGQSVNILYFFIFWWCNLLIVHICKIL